MSTPTAITDRRAAEDALREAGDRLRAARAEEAAARQALDPLVVAAFQAGSLKKDVVRLSELSPETVRGIARDHGIEAPAAWQDRPAPKRKRAPASQAQVVELRGQGASVADIARKLGISRTRVYQLLPRTTASA